MKKFALTLLLAASAASTGFAQLLINGAGATFPQPIYEKWFKEFGTADTSVQINYQGIGSGGGIKQILAETVDFGASDAPMSDDDLAKAPRQLLHLPTVAGAVAITYNLPDNPTIKLDGDTLAGIYLGKITKWNDPAIAGQNSGLKLPDSDIIVVHRADPSGTSFIFTDYLSKTSADWKSGPGTGKAVKWPVGLGGKGNEGVAGQIKQSPGAIGYVELAYAHQNNLAVAQLKNSTGAYITPSVDGVTAALASATIPDDFRFSVTNAPGEKSYPIVGATWLLVYAQQKDSAKGEKLVKFLKWAYTDGEKLAPSLDYAPLPDALVARALERVGSIKY